MLSALEESAPLYHTELAFITINSHIGVETLILLFSICTGVTHSIKYGRCYLWGSSAKLIFSKLNKNIAV